VSAAEPTDRLGLYWGYTVRVANKFEDIFEECAYQGGYDLKLAISNDKNTQPADVLDYENYRGFKHALVFFGGIEGIEGIVEQDENSRVRKKEAVREMFDEYINCLPERGTRCFRTEESVLVSLSNLYPQFR
jgi:predicted SPOUT superfamily RNA methylase MTH1